MQKTSGTIDTPICEKTGESSEQGLALAVWSASNAGGGGSLARRRLLESLPDAPSTVLMAVR